ncbi:MAG TPA: hypothetical protein VD735_00395, partial [Candidatus Saccharimonadales bacterium]|nr:hypothetical protein [Candidatus Saccharimonadales bacterium]
LTTSGKSPNIIEALKVARKRGMFCIVFSGKDGGPAVKWADIPLVVPSEQTTHIQEVQLNIVHTLCTLVEQRIMQEDQARNATTQYTHRELADLLTHSPNRK